MAELTIKRQWVPMTASASRWLGVKKAEIIPVTPGRRIQSPKKPERFATFYGKHPQPEEWLGDTWWLLEQEGQANG